MKWINKYGEGRDWDSPAYKNLRRLARKRDKHKCKWPECKGKAENVHHIMPWSKYPSLRYILDNVICLCRKHHNNIKGKEHCYVDMFRTILELDRKKKDGEK